MRIIEEKIYKFNELSKEVQEKLIEKEQENVRNDYVEFCLNDDMVEESKRLLEKYFGSGVEFKRVFYDLSYCQGSGAMIEFDINIEDLNNKYKIFSKEEIRFLTDNGIVDNIKVRHNGDFYYHEYTFGIDSYYTYSIDYDYDDIKDYYNINEYDFNTIEKRLDNLLIDSDKHYTKSEFIKDIISMNKELANTGYKLIEHDIDINWIKDNLNDNEYYENGEVYCCE